MLEPTLPSSEPVWTIPKQNLRMRYMLSTLNYLFQAVFATFTAKFITMYLYAYLTLSAWQVLLISSISYIPLLLKPFFAYFISKKNFQLHAVKSYFRFKSWLIGVSGVLVIVLIGLSFIVSPQQLGLFILGLFLAQLGFIGLDVLNDNLILEVGSEVSTYFSLIQQLSAVLGAILSLIIYNIFVPAEVASGNWQGLFLSMAGCMLLMIGVNALYRDVPNQSNPNAIQPVEFTLKKGIITPNHGIFLCLLFFLNAAYIVDFQSELIVSARFGDKVLSQLFLAQTIGSVLGYVIIVGGFFVVRKQQTVQKTSSNKKNTLKKIIFIIAGVYSLIYLFLMPFAPAWLLFGLSIGYSPLNTLMMVIVVELMTSFAPTNHRGIWYQINAVIYALSRFFFTNIGNGFYAGLDLGPTDPLLFYIAGGLLFLNLPILVKLKIPDTASSQEA